MRNVKLEDIHLYGILAPLRQFPNGLKGYTRAQIKPYKISRIEFDSLSKEEQDSFRVFSRFQSRMLRIKVV